MLLRKTGYQKLAKALAPLALAGKVHYLPNFECCRNCAMSRINGTDWGFARGIATFNVQMKEHADEFDQLELIMISPNPGFEGLAQLLVLVQLTESGFTPLEENDEPVRDSFLKIDGGLIIWSDFKGKAEVDPSVRKKVSYDLSMKSPHADSGSFQIDSADHSKRKDWESRRRERVAQGMLSLDELIVDPDRDAWMAILEEIAQSPNPPRVIPVDPKIAKDSLLRLQMTTQSYLGAVVYSTGGMVFGNGLVTLYGSGSEKIPNIATLNGLTTLETYPGAIVLGYDVFGGVFVFDAGSLGIDTGSVCFLSVDTLEWESMEMPYSNLLSWLIDGSNLEAFYENILWDSWKEDLKELPEDNGFHLLPPPSTTAWRDRDSRSVASVPLTELGALIHGMDVYKVS